MHITRTQYLVLSLTLFISSLLHAAPFRDGDIAVFYGDSITAGGKYYSYIYDYYLTRFPTRTISFINAGISGDSAGGAFGRMEEDVITKKPSVVCVMFGMNDVGRGNYVSNATPSQLAAQNNAIKHYEANMTKLLNTLAASATKPELYLLTPSPFDQTAINDRNNNQPGCNDGLGRCATFVRATAPAFHAKVIEFYAAMTALNKQVQQNNPKATIIGSDRVHPGAAGHTYMAYLFLKAQGVPAEVSTITIDTTATAKNATVSGLTRTATSLSFTVKENALPFPLDPAAAEMLTWGVAFHQELNQQMLTIKGLKAGMYQLKIDNTPTVTASAEVFAAGINLATNTTPQLLQAKKVAQINEQRRSAESKIRLYAAVRWYLGHRKVNPDDAIAVQQHYDNLPNKTGYYESRIPEYLKEWKTISTVFDRVNQLTAEARAAAQPVEHRYELIPAN